MNEYQPSRFTIPDMMRMVHAHGKVMDPLNLALNVYISMHPGSEWREMDVTDEVRREAPHLHLPDDVRFVIKTMWVNADVPADLIHGAVLFAEVVTDVDEAVTKLLDELKELEPGAKVPITEYVGLRDKPRESLGLSDSEGRVLMKALMEVVNRCGAATTHSTGIMYSTNGLGERTHVFGGKMVDNLVSEASAALEDDAKISSIVDAWAADYDDGGR